jgi:hypothetical protein
MDQLFSGLEPRPQRPCGPGPPGLALMTARCPGARPRANRPSPLSKPADTYPDPGQHLHWPWMRAPPGAFSGMKLLSSCEKLSDLRRGCRTPPWQLRRACPKQWPRGTDEHSGRRAPPPGVVMTRGLEPPAGGCRTVPAHHGFERLPNLAKLKLRELPIRRERLRAVGLGRGAR